METWLSIASAGVSILVSVLAWALGRSVRAADKAMDEAKKAATELEARVRTLETETIQALRTDLDHKLDAIKDTLGQMAADLAVLKDRDHNTRVTYRKGRRA